MGMKQLTELNLGGETMLVSMQLNLFRASMSLLSVGMHRIHLHRIVEIFNLCKEGT